MSYLLLLPKDISLLLEEYKEWNLKNYKLQFKQLPTKVKIASVLNLVTMTPKIITYSAIHLNKKEQDLAERYWHQQI
jgi:hypothetical protein